ncbi:MAG: 3-hydroxyacyl-ACP dehydratase FabZ family protein [Oligosphaeraceae bacterium]
MRAYTHHQIASILETAAPMLMLDMAELDENGGAALGCKAVSISEGVFQGHFPGQPILPGVLQVSAMVQLSRLLFQESIPGIGGTQIVLRQIRRLKFRKPVFPGMTMKVEACLQERRVDGEAEFQVSCSTEAGLASAGTLLLARVNTSDYDHPRHIAARPESPFREAMAEGTVTDALGLMEILPHRPPFLLLDKAVNLGQPDPARIYGCKNLSSCDMMMAGNTTGVYPFPLMLEAAAQLGCAHILSQPENKGKLGIFLGIDEANFYQHAKFGDSLVIAGHCDLGGRAGMAEGELWVDDQKIASCAMKFILVDSLRG